MAISQTQIQPELERPADDEQRRIQREKNQAAIDLLRSWRETTDPDEIRDQQETWEVLEQALSTNRVNFRRFPVEP